MDSLSHGESSSAGQYSLGSITHYYCHIPGCPVALRPCLSIKAHVVREHPDIFIQGSVGDISFELCPKRGDIIVKKLVEAHGKIFWVTLNYSARNEQLICDSVMADKDEDGFYPTRSVAILLSGFGHEILLNQNFESKKMKEGHPLNEPVAKQELSRIMNANNRIYALVQISRRPQRKKREENKSLRTGQRVTVTKAAQQGASSMVLIPEVILPPFHCVVSSCGMNIDSSDFVRHFKKNHPDLCISGKTGDVSLKLDRHARDELLFKLVEVYREIFVVMVVYRHHNAQLQFGSFMQRISENKKYVTSFRMSKRTATVEQTRLKILMNKNYRDPINDKTFALLTGDKVKEMVNSEGRLEITVKIQIIEYHDSH